MHFTTFTSTSKSKQDQAKCSGVIGALVRQSMRNVLCIIFYLFSGKARTDVKTV